MGRREQQDHARTYLGGLLSDLEHKNIESIAYRYDQDRMNLQRFIGWGAWDHAPLLTELASQVGEELGETDGVIVFDPSAFEKCGDDSVGVDRQWLGRLGKVDNGQVAVYMGYVSRREHALVAMRLFLPKTWARDRARRRKAGVPQEVRFRTRHQLALDMLAGQGGRLPHAWIAGDDEMGHSTRFRRELDGLGERYVLAVPSNTNLRDLEGRRPSYLPAPACACLRRRAAGRPGAAGRPVLRQAGAGTGPRPKRKFERVDRWRAARPASAWTRIDGRDGEKGPLMVEALKRPVLARTELRRHGAREELLVVTRVRDERGGMKYDYHLSNAPVDTPLEELVRVVKAEHRIEECLQRAKSEAGLADYEVRNWAGWHHHQTLSLMATWFLVREARRGKKVHAGDHRTADSHGPGVAVA
jgi:SRSO17 transposase